MIMTLRQTCGLCERRRITKMACYSLWLCTRCRVRWDDDGGSGERSKCKHPAPCACIACWDDDSDSDGAWRERNRADVRAQLA